MKRFARAGNRVVFVNSISMGLPGLASKALLRRGARRLRSYAKPARTTEEGIPVVPPAALPFYGSRAARAANRRLIAAQVGRLARSRGLTRPILSVAIPTAAEMIGRLGESLVLYHVSDKYDENSMDHATDPATIRRLHEQAIDRADIIFYSGRKLLDEAEAARERSYLLEQAVDFEHWSRVSAGPLEVGEEAARLPRPRVRHLGR